MTHPTIDRLAEQIKKLPREDQLLLIERIAAGLRSQPTVTDETSASEDERVAHDDLTWTDEELAELLKPSKPLTGRAIVEKHLASGVIGSWAD